MASGKTKIAELSRLIAENTSIVDEYLTAHALPTPSFDADGPLTVPIPAHEKAIIAAQDVVIASTQELHNLMKGPTEMLMGIGVSVTHPCTPISLASHITRPSIPTMYSVSVPSIATRWLPHSQSTRPCRLTPFLIACGLNEVDLRRIVRHAMSNHIFQDREGRVAHTAASRVWP